LDEDLRFRLVDFVYDGVSATAVGEEINLDGGTGGKSQVFRIGYVMDRAEKEADNYNDIYDLLFHLASQRTNDG
jgi:hypothetical protein